MKVLWLCGNPGLFRAKSLDDGGWIGALQTQLLNVYPDLQLVNVFEYPDNVDVFRQDRVIYYPVYIGKFDRIKSFLSIEYHDRIFLHRVHEIIGAERPDIIQCWGSELGFGLIAKQVSVPVVMHIQGLLNPYFDAFCPPAYSVESLLRALRYNLIVYLRRQWRPYRLFKYNAQREKEILSSMLYVLGRTEWDKECVSILAPQARYYYCSESLRLAVVKCSKWKRHNNNRLVVSSIVSAAIYKGLDVILRTAKLIKEEYGDDFEWNIYGIDDVHLHERLTGIFAKDVNVYPRGRVSAQMIAEKLTLSDVYCHQSYIENSPNSVCEAQYIGVPVVAAMVGGMDTLIQDGAGIMVPANDAYRSAYAILRLKREHGYAEKISKKEIELAELRHKGVEMQLMNIYKEILGKRMGYI